MQDEVVADTSKYGVGSSIPESELAAKILPREEQLKSEQAKVVVASSDVAVKPAPRHEIIEEHHAVMPVSAEQTKSTNT